MTKPSLELSAHKINALMAVAPKAVWITDENALRAYECDAYTAYRARPAAVVLPSETSEVAAILKAASRAGIDVVARGAGTSVVGGAMPKEGGIVIGLSRMNRVLEYIPDDRMILVECGITNLMVSHLVGVDGLFYAPDPSSQMACSIGGNIAMNSGGAHCLKYGVTTNNLIGVKLVTIEGEIIEFWQDDGLDIRGLICGSEGQLGIVTEAWLRLETKAANALPILIGFDSPENAGHAVASIINEGIIPVAIEYMDKIMIREIENYAHAGYPDVPALLIVELEGRDEVIALQMEAIERIALSSHAVEITRARDQVQSQRIWSGRKAAFGVMGRLGDYITLDGCVPISRLAEALIEIDELSKVHGLMVTNVFHAGDGNLHPLILYDAQKDGDLGRAERLGADILRKCVEMGGCLTGEHGVGIEKRELMLFQWNEYELEKMMQIKDVFDPNWHLNPDKVFPLALSRERRS